MRALRSKRNMRSMCAFSLGLLSSRVGWVGPTSRLLRWQPGGGPLHVCCVGNGCVDTLVFPALPSLFRRVAAP
eukprot:4162136-Amphidinium_carterae.1